MQSDYGETKHGTLYEALTSIDFLMTRLEELKNQQQHLPTSHFKASVILGWKKLNKYYELSDETPAYRAAIFLHPHYKERWFKRHWSDAHPAWITEARAAVKDLYQDYVRRHGDEAIVIERVGGQELSEFELYNTLADDEVIDDLERYCDEPPTPKVDPLQWWIANHSRFPVLRYMAFDLLAAPASSAIDERVFSMAGNVLTGQRFNTEDDLAESTQCLKSWQLAGLLQSSDITAAIDAVEAAPTTPPPPSSSAGSRPTP